MLFKVNPESGQVDDESSESDGEEFQLQVERQNFKQEFDLRFDNGSKEEQFHQPFLAFLALFSLSCFVRSKF